MRFHLFLALLLPTATFAAPASNLADRDTWLKDLKVEMKQKTCASDSHFRKCFTPTNEECQSLADKSFVYCTARSKSQIPAKLGEQEFNLWRFKIKACMGVSMSIALEDAKKAVQSDACSAESSVEKEGSDANTSVPVDVYLDQQSLSMPQDLCLDSMPHRTCYTVEQAECRKGITKAIQECIPELKADLPPTILLVDNKEYDMKIVQCLSPRFDKAFLAKRAKKGADYCSATFAALKTQKKKSGTK